MSKNKNIKTATICSTIAIAIIGGTVLHLTNTNYKDGTYRVEGDSFDNLGWKPYVELVIENVEILDVSFDYYSNKVNHTKSEDKDYNTSMLNIMGVNPSIFSRELAVELITKQSLEGLDGVSGATTSTKEFIELSNEALNKAEKGDTSTKSIYIKS